MNTQFVDNKKILQAILKQVEKYGYGNYCPKCGGNLRSGYWNGWGTNHPKWESPYCDCGLKLESLETEYSLIDAIKLKITKLCQEIIDDYINLRKYPICVRQKIKSHPLHLRKFTEADNYELFYEEDMNLYFVLKTFVTYCEKNNIEIYSNLKSRRYIY